MNVHIPSLMNDRFRNTWRYLAARAWEEEHGVGRILSNLHDTLMMIRY